MTLNNYLFIITPPGVINSVLNCSKLSCELVNVILILNCARILEYLPFGHKQTFWENPNENFSNFFKNHFLYIWIKQLFAVKFRTHSFFFLGDMDVISDHVVISHVWDNN